MNNLNKLFLFIIIFCTLTAGRFPDAEREKNPSLLLWYNKPAARWTEALPVGNGRLGAMIYGKTEKEVIQFNEETLWSGQPHDYAHPGAHQYLGQIRQLLWDGKQKEAEKLANEHFMSQPFGQLCYQPFGNLLLDFPGHEEASAYQRNLDLENAISSVVYEVDGVKFKREIFSSEPVQALVIRLESSKKGKLNFSAGMDSPHSDYSVTIENGEVVLRGKANNYPKEFDYAKLPYPKSLLTFEARLKIINEGGSVVQNEKSLIINNAKNATIILVAATSFVNFNDISGNPAVRCKENLANMAGKTYKSLRSEHIADYQKLFNRVHFDLGNSEISFRPTNERLISFQEDQDPSLVALLYQYGRYLLISSSRPGTQPANLQGIWNDRMAPPWDSKYTININAEMNYWPSEITNLSECTEPLIQMVKDLSVTGRKVAKEHYNMSGWVAHHNTDIWRGAAPINGSDHGIWPTGGAWLSQHLWWHYQFTGDKEYLKNTAYPVLREASQFFAEYLIPDPKYSEWLVSGPGNSPEQGGLVMGPVMDHQIIRELFANTIEAAEILKTDKDFVKVLKEKKGKIAPDQIGQHGQLQEWLEDIDDPKNEHRHVSHLWGLHPGSEIHPLTTPELADACKVTLSHRGDGGTGWSRAWKINFWARLLDGDHAFLLLKNLMVPSLIEGVEMRDKGGLYMNLFDAHPPFQIDGNFGATSGITEMLLQSHLRNENGTYFQDILPALPTALSTGKISGIKGRGGFEFSIAWKNNELVSLEVKSLLGNQLNMRYKGKLIQLASEKGKSYNFKINDFK
jgi:alpha-L-fucosidase 2